MKQKSRYPFSKSKTGDKNGAKNSSLRATILKPEQVPSIKPQPFDLDIKVLLQRGDRWRHLGAHGMAQTR